MPTSAAVLRTYTEEDLQRQLREAKEELFNLRFQAATGQLESHGRLRMVRRDIARIYTVLRERELGIIGYVEPEEAPAEEAAEAKTEADESEEAKPKKAAKKSTAKKSTAKKTAKKAAAKDEADDAGQAGESTDGDASTDEGDAK